MGTARWPRGHKPGIGCPTGSFTWGSIDRADDKPDSDNADNDNAENNEAENKVDLTSNCDLDGNGDQGLDD